MKQVLQMAWQKALGVVVLCGLAVLTMTAQAKFDPDLLIGQWWCKAESKTRQSDAFITYDQNGNSQTDEVGAVRFDGKTAIFRYQGTGKWQIKDDQYQWQTKTHQTQANDYFWEIFPRKINEEKEPDFFAQIIRLDDRHFDYQFDSTTAKCTKA